VNCNHCYATGYAAAATGLQIFRDIKPLFGVLNHLFRAQVVQYQHSNNKKQEQLDKKNNNN